MSIGFSLGLDVTAVTVDRREPGGGTVDNLLLETGDALLLETGDALLLE